MSFFIRNINLKWFKLLKNVCIFSYSKVWGWSDKNMKKEISDSRMRFLVATDDKTGKDLAFASFRFDLDFNEPVLYCYELQADSKLESKDIKKFLMHILHLIAIKFAMHKVLITVTKNNECMMKYFIEQLNYKDNPSGPFGRSYKILCYFVPRREKHHD